MRKAQDSSPPNPVPPPLWAPRVAAAPHLFGPRRRRPHPVAREKESCKQNRSLRPKLCGRGSRGPLLLSPRSARRCRVDSAQRPLSAQVSLTLLGPPGFCSLHPALAATPQALPTSSVPGLGKSSSRSRTVPSLSRHKLPQDPRTLHVHRDVHKPCLRGRAIPTPGAPSHTHAHSEVPSSPRAPSPAPAKLPSGPGSCAHLPGAQPARSPGTLRLISAAPRLRGRTPWPKLCSLTVFFLATIFSSFLAILRSSSSWPMLAHDAPRRDGRWGSGRASGAGGAEAEGAQHARDANTHDTHAWRGRGPPPRPPASDVGEGWRALNIDFKDLLGQRLPAPAGAASRAGGDFERGAFLLGPFPGGSGVGGGVGS